MAYADSAQTLGPLKNRDDEISVVPVGGDVTVAIEVNGNGSGTWQDVATVADGAEAIIPAGKYRARVRLTPASEMEYAVLVW